MLRFLLILALLFPSGALAKKKGKKPKRAESAQELYEQGLRHMKRGYHTKALEKFNRVRNYHRDDPVSVKAQLAIADVHFKKGDYEQARFTYEEFASYHPRHENLDYVTYRIGLSIYKRASKLAGRDQSPTRGAVNNWTGFNTRFPESSYAEEVDKLLTRSRNRLASKELFVAKFYADRDAWGSVRRRTEYLLRKYPNTEPVPQALMLLGTALHNWGEVEQSAEIRTRLAKAYPDSPQLRKLDRVQAQPAGMPPDERIFIRPYRIRGVSPLGGGAY